MISQKSTITFMLLGIFLLMSISIVLLQFDCDTTQRHTILTIDKVEDRHGDIKHFSTTVYYIVSTDKGAYHIRTTGINAAPECAGIQVGHTYLLRTRGISIPLLGMYPCIIRQQLIQ